MAKMIAIVVLTLCINSTRGRGGHEPPCWIRAWYLLFVVVLIFVLVRHCSGMERAYAHVRQHEREHPHWVVNLFLAYQKKEAVLMAVTPPPNYSLPVAVPLHPTLN